MTDLRIVFMGTPDFAVASLRAMVENGFNIVGVITAPDKPAGRGHKLQASAVKQYAQSANLPVLQPTNLKSPEFLAELAALKANLQVVVAFRMLPVAVWDMPELGTFNLHGSLLPQYRGAAPINWAVINGETETGVSTFFLQHEIDTGDMIHQARMPLGPNETAGEVHDRMMVLGAELVVKTLHDIQAGEVNATPQDDSMATLPAPKIHKHTCEIDWNKSAQEVHNHIRGLSPFPGAWTNFNGKALKIYKCTVSERAHAQKAGTIITDNKSYLDITCGEGAISVHLMQLPGKKRLPIEDLLRGYSFESGSSLS